MSGTKLDRDTHAKAFSLMGESLARDRVYGEINLFDGSAIMFQMSYRENTQDVDCVVETGHGAVLKAAICAARKLKLPMSWLNEQVTMYTSKLHDDSDFTLYGVYPSYGRPYLRVQMAKPEYLLAMKVEALSRAAERDIADVISLSNHLGISNTDEVLAVRERYFTDKPSMEVLRVLNSITEFAGHEMDETDAPVKPK